MDARIGANVARLRGGKSQRDTAAAMRERGWKWSHVTLVSIEAGERPLRLAEAMDLAEVLGQDVRVLIEPVGTLAWNEAFVNLDRARRKLGDAVGIYIADVSNAVIKVSDVDLTESQNETIQSMVARGPVQIAAEAVSQDGVPMMTDVLNWDVEGLAPATATRFERATALLKPAFDAWWDEADDHLRKLSGEDG